MSRFANTEDLRKIDLGEDEWIKVRKSISFREIQSMKATNGTEEEKTIEMFLLCMREWNLKNDEGEIVPLNEENLVKLDLQTIDILNKELLPLFQNDQDKKK